MALEGLQLMEDQEQTSEVNADLKYPDLTNMLHYICNQQPKLLNSSEIGERMLLFPSKAYVAMIKFLMKCFKADFESSKISIETGVSHSEIFTLFSILEHAMAFEGSVELHATATKALVEIGAYLPEVSIIFQLILAALLSSFSSLIVFLPFTVSCNSLR